MIYFFADVHYNARPGAALHDLIKDAYPISFHEDRWEALEDPAFPEKCSLLILNMISGSCNIPAPSAAAEANVRKYVEQGGSLLLLHVGSAAFWHCDWWRPLVGHRWVRGEDADGFAASVHPVRPYRVEVAKCRHPLCRKLKPMDLPTDEIFIQLEQTCPTTVLMTTTTDEGTFPMAYECHTPFGGRVLGFIPGHNPEVVRLPVMVGNIRVLIDDLIG